MEKIEKYFEKYSNLYQFEEGNPEYLVDKVDFKLAMEEYGKQIYNQALEDAFKSAEVIDDYRYTTSSGYSKYKARTIVNKKSILKLKKL